MTDDWHDLFPTFISQVMTANIVMWVMRLNIVDWGYFNVQALQEILINIRRSFVHLWKWNISHTLDVQEANVSVAQLY